MLLVFSKKELNLSKKTIAEKDDKYIREPE
jgi:hypothetical protein